MRFQIKATVFCGACGAPGDGSVGQRYDDLDDALHGVTRLGVVGLPTGWKEVQGSYTPRREAFCARCAPFAESDLARTLLALAQNFVDGHPPRVTYSEEDGWWYVENVKCREATTRRPAVPEDAPTPPDWLENFRAWFESQPSEEEARAFARKHGWAPAR